MSTLNMQPGATPPEDPPPQRDDPPSSERVLLGYNGNLILRENGVLITRGAKGFWTQGSIRGEKLIPWESVVAVQFKKAGFGLQGYLQLSLRGGSEAKSGIGEAIKDENTVSWFRPSKNDEFSRAADLIRARIESAPHGSTKTCPECAEEVKAAAKLCRFCGYRFDA